jgi:hypothetical protein
MITVVSLTEDVAVERWIASQKRDGQHSLPPGENQGSGTCHGGGGTGAYAGRALKRGVHPCASDTVLVLDLVG